MTKIWPKIKIEIVFTIWISVTSFRQSDSENVFFSFKVFVFGKKIVTDRRCLSQFGRANILFTFIKLVYIFKGGKTVP